jgi:hypothetical protein
VDLVPFGLQAIADQIADVRVVIDDENSRPRPVTGHAPSKFRVPPGKQHFACQPRNATLTEGKGASQCRKSVASRGPADIQRCTCMLASYIAGRMA